MSNHTDTITGNALLNAAQKQLDSGKLSHSVYHDLSDIIMAYKNHENNAPILITAILAAESIIENTE